MSNSSIHMRICADCKSFTPIQGQADLLPKHYIAQRGRCWHVDRVEHITWACQTCRFGLKKKGVAHA